jgi:hypothetical protein
MQRVDSQVHGADDRKCEEKVEAVVHEIHIKSPLCTAATITMLIGIVRFESCKIFKQCRACIRLGRHLLSRT